MFLFLKQLKLHKIVDKFIIQNNTPGLFSNISEKRLLVYIIIRKLLTTHSTTKLLSINMIISLKTELLFINFTFYFEKK